VWTFASLLVFSQSALFFELFPICNCAFNDICLYTIPPSAFWSSS
jgi:hypothetical protein